MSDPVTNVEIEDVLSSIRRLIADGDRPEPADEPDSSEFGSGDGPLVLTPSLRVAEQVVAQGSEQGSEQGSSQAGQQASARNSTSADDPLATARMAARLEVAVTAEDDDFEPDGSELAAAGVVGVVDEDAMPVFRSHDRRHDRHHLATDRAPGVLPGNRLSEEADNHEEGHGEVDGDLFPGLDQLPEEQILRDLIAEVLRDELAGGLGERITRNVRKLVRREIYRILESRGLE